MEVEKVLGALRAQGIAVQVQLADGEVMADPARLRQVLRNLVSNTVKHGSPPFGV